MLPLFGKAFVTLFVVIDPVSLAPIFMLLTLDRSTAEKLQIARQAVLISALILLVFGLVGSLVLDYLEVSLEAFQAAAGFLLFKLAIDMVFAHTERETEEEEKEARSRQDITVFPLAIPLIAGPGALASVSILSHEAQSYYQGLTIVLGTAGLVLVMTYMILRLSNPLSNLLGQTGINVITRVLGVLLSALAVQYMANGISGLVQNFSV
ncbi:MarC family transcriptional regulator [Leptolyngbya sp. 'hensonii']|uniref:MarC family protein n=1 Tax=Leptolyngbya sp. 'hensonii' TaxID=1922337 RepID=UPI00094FEDA3|nr:MarC family protein [Leptolyngbya sp. 'hensonii']OLP15635.1 MarC family transcriptional regulator [Leptolyngbya sp. 'hensonii']